MRDHEHVFKDQGGVTTASPNRFHVSFRDMQRGKRFRVRKYMNVSH